MKSVAAIVKDKNHIELLNPIDIEERKKITIIIHDENNAADERDDFLNLSLQHIKNAYVNEEPEYLLSMIKEPNQEYGL